MKTLVFTFLTLVSLTALADERVLDCNLGMGPLQQVTIYQRSNGFELANLNSSGSLKRHSLPEKEVIARKINLRIPLIKGTLEDRNGVWYYRIGSDGFTVNGVADCWVDKI